VKRTLNKCRSNSIIVSSMLLPPHGWGDRTGGGNRERDYHPSRWWEEYEQELGASRRRMRTVLRFFWHLDLSNPGTIHRARHGTYHPKQQKKMNAVQKIKTAAILSLLLRSWSSGLALFVIGAEYRR
jgi:hypothetical protein